MKKIFALLLACSSFCLSMAWSQKGHDVTAYIAEQHLTPATRAAVDSLLKGRSMVYWANWLDNASHTPEYAYSKTWHYKNINEGVPYDKAGVHPDGNIETALYDQIAILQTHEPDPEKAALALKMIIHLMGDLHQPMHLGHQTDLGGNKTKVKFFGRDTNLHTVWDGNMVESAHKWSYSEWQEQIDRPATYNEEAILAGTVTDWGRQTWAIATDVYGSSPVGTNISYDYIAMFTPAIEQQLLNGGLRLAHVLNTIFDPNY